MDLEFHELIIIEIEYLFKEHTQIYSKLTKKLF